MALGAFGEHAKTAIPALIERLRDEHWEVPAKAAEALKKIDPQAPALATAAMIEALNDPSESVRCRAAFALPLVDAEAKSVPVLVRMLREDAPVRYAAAWSLGEMGPKARSAVPALVEALKDGDKSLRREAASALKRIDPAGVKAAVR